MPAPQRPKEGAPPYGAERRGDVDLVENLSCRIHSAEARRSVQAIQYEVASVTPAIKGL